MAQARYKSLVDQLALEIRQGSLPPGTRLPTHRELAAREGLALVTATRVYAELEAMGLVSGETGRGTFVRESALPRGLGSDQHATAAGMCDLTFNYPSLPGQADLLRVALRQLAADGMTMVVVSHEIGFAASVANRITFLDQGRLLLHGTPGEIFGKPRHPRLDQFLDTYLDRGAAMLV